ncbi:hypothetical protein GCM10025859_67380 [Alicyclobacillus fastidiosus]|nr:hypothetical protein GCM10025859_67380 [Alicyclobacillus fastidiosus]
MDGAFGGYTRWAVVFLIIFVLFILLVPYATPTTTVGFVPYVKSLTNVAGVPTMDGCFGACTRWAVVFLIIFVLFILLVPYSGGQY